MNRIDKTSTHIIHEAYLTDEIVRLNALGWVVTNGRATKKTNEIALQCIYIGFDAKTLQDKQIKL